MPEQPQLSAEDEEIQGALMQAAISEDVETFNLTIAGMDEEKRLPYLYFLRSFRKVLNSPQIASQIDALVG